MWDLAGEDQILKLETKALGGRINDLDWDMESKRIVVGGDGRDRFAAAFSFDTGSSVGELVRLDPLESVPQADRCRLSLDIRKSLML